MYVKMFINLGIIVLLLISQLSFSSEKRFLGYVVKFTNNETEGYILLTIEGEKILSDFYNLSKNSHLPFYAEMKTTIGDNKVNKLIINNTVYKVFYNLNEISKKELLLSGLNESIKDKYIIIFENEYPKYSVKKSDVVNLDFLINSFNNGNILEGDFFLFEPQNKIKFPIYIKKETKESFGSCSLNKFTIYLKKKKLYPIAHLYVDDKDNLVYIEAQSKRWKLYLANKGNKKIYKVPVISFYKNKLINEIKKSLNTFDYNLNIYEINKNKNNLLMKIKFIHPINMSFNKLTKILMNNDNNIEILETPNSNENSIYYINYEKFCDYIDDSLSDDIKNFIPIEKINQLSDTEQPSVSYEINDKKCSNLILSINNIEKVNSKLDKEDILHLNDNLSLKILKFDEDRIDISDDDYIYKYNIKLSVEIPENLLFEELKSFLKVNNFDLSMIKDFGFTEKGKPYIEVDLNKIKYKYCSNIGKDIESLNFINSDNMNIKVYENKCVINNILFDVSKNNIIESIKKEIYSKYRYIKWLNANFYYDYENAIVKYKIPKVFKNCLNY